MFRAEEIETIVRIARRELAAIGGKGRAKKLSKQRRSEIARKASRARWGKKEKAIA